MWDAACPRPGLPLDRRARGQPTGKISRAAQDRRHPSSAEAIQKSRFRDWLVYQDNVDAAGLRPYFRSSLLVTARCSRSQAHWAGPDVRSPEAADRWQGLIQQDAEPHDLRRSAVRIVAENNLREGGTKLAATLGAPAQDRFTRRGVAGELLTDRARLNTFTDRGKSKENSPPGSHADQPKASVDDTDRRPATERARARRRAASRGSGGASCSSAQSTPSPATPGALPASTRRAT